MQFYSPGKLMITGEYAVLQSAKAFALPTRFGQYLSATATEKDIEWVAKDRFGEIWFEATFNQNDPSSIQTTNFEVAQRLFKLIHHCLAQNSSLRRGWKFESKINFNRNWGLGSSSSLVANLAKWSGCDPYDLLHSAFSGSGYDVAVGIERNALTYQLELNSKPKIEIINWRPAFTEQLFFVYLGAKQNSDAEIHKTSDLKLEDSLVSEITSITNQVVEATSLQQFSDLLTHHENIISKYLGRKTIKEQRFPDYPLLIKSLGAWGGDFVMVVGDLTQYQYFLKRGYDQILSFEEMIEIAHHSDKSY